MTRRAQIRALAKRLLRANGIHCAPVPIDRLAETVGAEVRESPANNSLSGFLLRGPGGRAIIGVNSRHAATRRRFTIAHELGHFLLHGGDRLHVDRREQGLQIRLRHEAASTGSDREEVEANVFAAEVLMPADFVSRDLGAHVDLDLLEDDAGLDELVGELAERYQVSRQALSFRLINLGYVDQ